MKKKKTVTTLLLGLAMLALAGLVTAHIAGFRKTQAASPKTCAAPNAFRTTNTLRQQAAPQQQQQEEPTVVQEGVMTDRQKKHGKLFKRYGTLTAGRKLKDAPSETGDVTVAVEVGDRLRPDRPFDLNTYLRDNACKADAVVVGAVKSKASQLTEDGTFAFTDYEFTIEEVLKNNAAAPLNTGSQITIARAGGVVKLQGRTLRAFDQSEKPLESNGRFLLFLQYIPDTGDYKSCSGDLGDASFQLRGDKLSQVSEEPLPEGTGRNVDATSFLTKVRAAVYGACNN
jgi:hypothetical protein